MEGRLFYKGAWVAALLGTPSRGPKRKKIKYFTKRTVWEAKQYHWFRALDDGRKPEPYCPCFLAMSKWQHLYTAYTAHRLSSENEKIPLEITSSKEYEIRKRIESIIRTKD